MLKKSIFQKVLAILLVAAMSVALFAGTSKYRLSLRGDAATTMVIGWSDEDADVYYGTSDKGTSYSSYPNKVSKSSTVDKSRKGMSHHFARLTGLKPNTVYYYVIRSSSTSPRMSFKTAPSNGTGFSIIAGGDSRSRPDWRRKGNKLVAKLRPQAILFAGDYTDDDTDSQWKQWLNDWQETRSSDGRMYPIVGTIGNHEDDENVLINIFDHPGKWYTVTVGDILVAALSTEGSYSTQKSWLKNKLINTSKNWKIAFYHKPMRPHGPKSDKNDVKDAFAGLFYDYRVQLSVDGDTHTVKTTYPIRPSSSGEDGFKRDDSRGTVYTGEGTWGVSPRSYENKKSWTRHGGSFCQFKWIWVGSSKMILRTVKFENVDNVKSVSDSNPFAMPSGIKTFGGDVSINGGFTVTTKKNDAAYVSQTVPTTMTPGQTTQVTVAMKNTGTSTWTASAKHRLGTESDSWGTKRAYLANNVSPGVRYDFKIDITAPTTPGTYDFQWKMVQDGVAWFGSSSTKRTITVKAGGTPTPTPTITPTPTPTVADTFVTLVLPEDNKTFASGSSVPMKAEASDDIDDVFFYLDDGVKNPYIVIIEKVAPFSKSAFDLPDGYYSVWAVGKTYDGGTIATGKVSFKIGGGGTPTPTPGANLLKNASFESGKVIWEGFNSTWILSAEAKDGSKSAKNLGGSSDNLKQWVDLEPGTDYTLSAWIRTSTSSAGRLYIDTHDVFDGAGQGEFMHTTHDNKWHFYSGSFNSGSVTRLKIRSYGSKFSGTGRIDDIKLQKK